MSEIYTRVVYINNHQDNNMTHIKYILFLSMASFQIMSAEWQNSSDEGQTTLIELYTSEGCSSCPPADEFLSQFRNSDELWTKYIPIAFHVDYWDYIGWKDVFASPNHSNRQRQHKNEGNISSVYTPGFVVNGKEWPGFFKPWRALPDFNKKPGVLTVNIDRHIATVNFPAATTDLQYNMTVVGMGMTTDVAAGENKGYQLPHDFVVLDHQKQSAGTYAVFNLPLIVKHNPEQFAIVAWVSSSHSLTPIQATGGFLPNGLIKTIQ